MAAFLEMTGNVAMFMLLMLPGWILGKTKHLAEHGVDAMGLILTNIAMPALVLCKLLELNSSVLSLSEILISALMPVIIVPVGCVITRLVFCRGERSVCASARFCAIFSNCGFLGIPMAVALFPDEPRVAVCVSLFNVVSTFLLLTLGVTVLSGGRKKWNWETLLLAPVTLCMILGALLLWIGCESCNRVLQTYTSYFAMLTAPLSMLILGYELSKLSVREVFRCRLLYPVSMIKLVLLPTVALGILCLLRLLPWVEIGDPLAMAMLLAIGVSTAASAPALACANGADRACAVILTLGSTLLCTLTLPLLRMIFVTLF